MMEEEKKPTRKRSYKKQVKDVNSKLLNIDAITNSVDKLDINDDCTPEKITTHYSKSGNFMFQYSNKKTPFENACPWIQT